MKNYTQDKKSLEIILNKFKDNNIEISLITKNNKYIDTYISFNKKIKDTRVYLILDFFVNKL